MFTNIPIFSDDAVWINILSDLGAKISDNGIIFTNPKNKMTVPELSDYIEELKAQKIKSLNAVDLSDAEQKLLLLLPANAVELKERMGYSSEANTHTVETLVYNIRKKLGPTFIKLENGEYKL
jgi:alanine-alpha-ketoisovalerate/valine-pyruvate aminotransferase